MRWQMIGLLCLVFALPTSRVDAAAGEVEHKVSLETVDFSDFPVEASDQALEFVDFDSHRDAISFRSRFNAQMGRPANFAGHYRLVYWGCGTGCQQFSIVDIRTGQVSMNEAWSTSLGLCFRADSALLITNPGAGESMRMETRYYQWDGKQLNPLARVSMSVLEYCDSGYE
ncbi:hypothetical protein [Marinobacter litoralis]|uniref:hypothetical protein n=1 Tax=Marinobacter litoralis TaxID=187981 RepID=UPI0018EB8203|nr:hypothetical protein [Marinobacter litoralis]MBJ6136990.1 hypothetical protein [Marinobacter litoralis]